MNKINIDNDINVNTNIINNININIVIMQYQINIIIDKEKQIHLYHASDSRDSVFKYEIFEFYDKSHHQEDCVEDCDGKKSVEVDMPEKAVYLHHADASAKI